MDFKHYFEPWSESFFMIFVYQFKSQAKLFIKLDQLIDFLEELYQNPEVFLFSSPIEAKLSPITRIIPELPNQLAPTEGKFQSNFSALRSF